MPSTSTDVPLPRRNARSFDLDDSATKAAAWVWHLHTSKPGITTEGRFVSPHSRRRSSGNFDRKATRFQQEAVTMSSAVAGANKKEKRMWDCGSNLYDTFELVALGNRLDRSLMEAIPIVRSEGHAKEHHVRSPGHEPGGILRTLSLPRSLVGDASKNQAQRTPIESPESNMFKISKSCNNGTRAGSAKKAATRWSRVEKFMNAFKKVVLLHKQMSFVGCKRGTNVIESTLIRPLDQISEKENTIMCTGGNQLSINGKISNKSSRDSECMGQDDESSIQSTMGRGNYKLSIPRKGMLNYKINCIGDDDGAAMQKKIKSNSESMVDGSLEHKKIRTRIKGSNLDDVCVKPRISAANSEHVDYYNHLHHHHHHHHHHHYLHHSLSSESARLSPETLSKICAEQNWLI